MAGGPPSWSCPPCCSTVMSESGQSEVYPARVHRGRGTPSTSVYHTSVSVYLDLGTVHLGLPTSVYQTPSHTLTVPK